MFLSHAFHEFPLNALLDLPIRVARIVMAQRFIPSKKISRRRHARKKLFNEP
jgi:hypothetical protein